MDLVFALLALAAPPGGKAEELAPGGVIPTEDAPARDVITLSRGPCYGVCPIYTVSIDSSGAITYDGERFVKVTGNRSSKVTPNVFEALAERFDDAQFDTLSVPANCPNFATDHPTMVLTRTHGDKVHKVEHNTGNGCAPEVLFELEQAVDQATNSAKYVKGPGSKAVLHQGDQTIRK